MVNICCLKCGKDHEVDYSTVHIYGPVVHVKCPFCKKESHRGFSKFAELQMGKNPKIGRFSLVADMIKFSRKLEGKVLDG